MFVEIRMSNSVRHGLLLASISVTMTLACVYPVSAADKCQKSAVHWVMCSEPGSDGRAVCVGRAAGRTVGEVFTEGLPGDHATRYDVALSPEHRGIESLLKALQEQANPQRCEASFKAKTASRRYASAASRVRAAPKTD